MTIRNAKGFTLIELLIVVAIIAILAVMAIPSIQRGRMAGNESSALASLKAIRDGQATFAASCAAGGYAQSLPDLSKAPNGSSAGFVSPDLDPKNNPSTVVDAVDKSGYTVVVAQGVAPKVVTAAADTCNAADADAMSSYFASATPISAGSSGDKAFGIDERGTTFQKQNGAVAIVASDINPTPQADITPAK